MPFYFTCPYCLNKTLVGEELSGKSGPCVGCGKTVTIPAAPSAKRTDIAPVEQAASPQLVELRRPPVARWLVRVGIYSLALLPIVIASIWFMQPVVVKLKAQRDIALCKQNLQQIAKALNNYAADYGTYPPAVTYDASGKAMHSWRVLILPYLNERKLYETYDMSKPWDAAENSHLQAQIPAVYVSPANSNIAIGESSYMLITGPGTLFPPKAPPGKPSEVPDGAENTILVVETNNRISSWIEPVDLDATKLPARIGMLGGIGGSHRDGAPVVFVNEQAVFLPSDAAKPVVDGLISPAGGEAVMGNWYQ